jgi:integrase
MYVKMKASASVKIVLDTRYEKQKSNTFPVRVRITHNRKQKYYATSYEFTEKDWAKMNGARPGELKDPLFEIRDIEKRAAKIIEKMPAFSFELFKKKFENLADTKTLSGAFTAYSNELRQTGRIGTAISYECARESLKKYKGDKLLTEVTVEFLNEYEEWMKTQGRTTTTIGMYLRALRSIINKAISEENFPKELYPFGRRRYEVPKGRNIKKALTLQDIEKIYNAQLSGTSEKSRDLWLFIYFCNGINAKDLCRLKYSNINRDFIEWERAKTVRTKKSVEKIKAYLNEDMKRIIEKHGNRIKPENYIFKVRI